MNQDKIVGNNLRLIRETNKYTQEQVSNYLEINRSTYSNYETGEREIPMDLLEKLSNLMGCELSLFFEENDEIRDKMLTCAFRIDSLSSDDMNVIAKFKSIVMNYLKMDQLISEI